MRHFLLILLCCWSLDAFAQEIISTDFLLFGKMDSDQVDTTNVGDALSKLGNLSIVDKWEFRTETDEWDLARQEYTLRASFNNLNSNDIYNEINDINKESFVLLDKQYYENKVFQKYKNIIELYYLERKSALADSILAILKDQKIITDFELSNGTSSNVNDLVKIDFEIRENNIDQNAYAFKKNLIVEKLDLNLDGKSFRIDTKNWVSNLTIIDVLEIKSALSNSEIDLKEQKLKYSEIELKRQSTEAKRILDFVQLKYAGRNELTPIKDFSLGVGINIPTKSSNIRKRSEALVDKLEDELELKQIKANVVQEIEDLIFKIKMKNIEYISYKKYYDEMQSSKTAKVFEEISDPKSILEYKLNNLKLQKDLIGIENELIEEYLELLFVKGWYLDYPDSNFLSNNLSLK